MIHQKKGTRALWAVAFTAAPIGALAGPLAPQFSCSNTGQLDSISWPSGDSVISKGLVAMEFGTDTTTKETSVPLTCNANWNGTQQPINASWDIEQVAPDAAVLTAAGTKTDMPPAGNYVIADAELAPADSFSINFGVFHPGKMGFNFVPVTTKVDYEAQLTVPGFKTEPQIWVTDYYLDLDAENPATGNLIYQDYLGVQVITVEPLTGTSAFSLNNLGELIFDPPVNGPTMVNLLSARDPSVPEPATLALMAAGLLGMAAVTLRRKKDGSGGGEPEA